MRGRLQGNTQEGGAFPLGRFDRLPSGLDGPFSLEFGPLLLVCGCVSVSIAHRNYIQAERPRIIISTVDIYCATPKSVDISTKINFDGTFLFSHAKPFLARRFRFVVCLSPLYHNNKIYQTFFFLPFPFYFFG
jgi:hypothetical protein